MSEPRGHVTGSHNTHAVMFYGISTCIWCRKTRRFLEDEQIDFEFVYVDLLEGEEREAVVETVKQFNPKASFPTVVIDSETCIVGYKPDAMKEILEL